MACPILSAANKVYASFTDSSFAGVRFSGLTADDRMSSGELGPASRRRVGSADEGTEMEAELARVHREMQRRFGDQVSTKILVS